jgi:hypothetical protein
MEISKEKIQSQVKELMESSIQQVLKGEKKSVKLHYCRPNDVIEYIERIGGEDLEDFESNGWKWNYFLKVEHNGIKYELSGDGYYQDWAEFEICE